MANTIKEMVYSQVSPQEVFESFYGLNHRERMAYETLLEATEPLSVEAIAERMDCSLSTAYRYVDTLESSGLIRQTGIFDEEYLKSGYVPEDPAVIADLMEQFVEVKYEQCAENIDEMGGVPPTERGHSGSERDRTDRGERPPTGEARQSGSLSISH